MKRYILILSIFFLGNSITSSAQTDSSSSQVKFKLGGFYTSHLHYYGRTDSLRSSGFFPLAELWFNKNIYINAAPVFINNSLTSFEYAGSVLTAGYQFNHNNKSSGHFYLVKPVYKDNSQLVQSALKAQFSSNLTWLNKFANITGGADIRLSDHFDYGMSAGLDHIFRFQLPAGSVIVVDPTAYVNAGTRQFSRTYYKKSSFLLFPGVEQIVTEEAREFKVLSYEFSVPVIFAKGKFQVIAIPSYVIPMNLVVVEGRPDLSERGEKLFYGTFGAKYIF
jgi:hypothetical protein